VYPSLEKLVKYIPIKPGKLFTGGRSFKNKLKIWLLKINSQRMTFHVSKVILLFIPSQTIVVHLFFDGTKF
jgi:hypothetical protein